MSFSLPISAFQALDVPPSRFPRRELPKRAPRSGSPARTTARTDHPILFMGGFLLAISLGVIGLWQGLGLLLPH